MKSPQGPKKPTSSPAQRTNVLLENLATDFRTFGEGQAALLSDMKYVKDSVLELSKDVTFLKDVARIELPEIRRATKDIKVDLAAMSERLVAIETRSS